MSEVRSTPAMSRYSGVLLALSLASVSAGPPPGKTRFSPSQVTVEIGEEAGDGIDGINAGIEVGSCLIT